MVRDLFVDCLIRQVRAFREGGHTLRHHTAPHIGDDSIAQHSWHVTVLLVILAPEHILSRGLLLAALFHDVHERWAGDPPATIGWGEGNKMKQEYKALARTIREGLGLPSDVNLNEVESQWLKACDMLEIWLWAQDQINMGNMVFDHIKGNAERWFQDNQNDVPNVVIAFITRFKWERSDDVEGWKLPAGNPIPV